MDEQRLTVPERNDLRKLEAVIDRGIKSFVEVGNALAEIRDLKLYREHHKTFAAYVEDRFGFKKTRAYELIDAAKVAEELSGMPDKIPNARVAVELAKAEPEQRQEILQGFAESNVVPTAKAVREKVEAVTQPPLTRQQVRDSESEERERIDRWVAQFGTFQNPLIAVQAIIGKLDTQQLGMVRLMLEV